MGASWRALRFLLAHQGGLASAPSPVRTQVGPFACDVVPPMRGDRGTVLTIHGMSPLGERDARMLSLHGALSRLGFRVVSPHLPSIAALRIHAGQIDDVERAIAAVASDPALCPDGRLGLFAVSFSAGLSLIAAGRPRVADRISGICTIGTFGDIESTMEAVLTRPEMTSYAWKIVLANFLDASIGHCPAVGRALTVAALDEWWLRTDPELPRVLQTLSTEDRTLVEDLLASPELRAVHVERILSARPLMLDLASVVDQVDGLRAPVSLLHGADDRTIPAEESRRLHTAMQAAGVSSRLHVSPLLGHGGATASPAALADLPALLAAFEGWFADVERDEGIRPFERLVTAS